MMKKTLVLLTISLITFLVPALSNAQGASAEGKSSGPIQTQETEFQGVVAELTECKRKEGVLTVKVTFRNTGSEDTMVNIETDHGKYEKIYVTADSKKYFVLKDTENEPLAPKYISDTIKKGQKILWWAKFPAPPAEVKTINLFFPKVLPFEDVPIKD
ncbi:MAG TPA: hypothetical protein VLH08_07635 [Acidobacteriota bacterium]|nr:hypothetical protein [Acidobacteriota bacterium]